MGEEPANLPALVTHQGGALVEVLRWPQYLEQLDQTQQTKIAILVRSFPGLNTETGVDLLADAMVFYRMDFDAWFAGLLEENSIETITIALEVLHHYSIVGGAEELLAASDRPGHRKQDDRKRERLELDRLLELIVWLRELGQELDSFTQCDNLLDRLGGWEVARLLDYSTIKELLTGDLTLEELHSRAEAPQDSKDEDADAEDDCREGWG
jgi:hypothetical protein